MPSAAKFHRSRVAVSHEPAQRAGLSRLSFLTSSAIRWTSSPLAPPATQLYPVSPGKSSGDLIRSSVILLCLLLKLFSNKPNPQNQPVTLKTTSLAAIKSRSKQQLQKPGRWAMTWNLGVQKMQERPPIWETDCSLACRHCSRLRAIQENPFACWLEEKQRSS